MRLKELFEKWRFLSYTQEDFDKYAQTMAKNNLHTLRRTTAVIFFASLFAVVYLLLFGVRDITIYLCIYELLISIIIHIICLNLLSSKENLKPAVIEFFIIVFMVLSFYFAIFIGTVFCPNNYAVTVIWFFGFIQIIFDLSPLKNALVILPLYVIFVFSSLYAKSIDLAQFDILRCTVTVLIGLITSWNKTRLMLSNIIINDKYKIRSITDALTTLPNRREIFKRSLELQRICIENGIPFTCMVIDIDDFKKYNDHYGHPQGDILLEKIGLAFKKYAEEMDIKIGRIGGEEFLVIFANKVYNENAIADGIRKLVEDMKIPHVETNAKIATISIGLYKTLKNIDTTKDNSYYIADQALYKAKKNGKNVIYKYDDAKKRYVKLKK